MNEANPYADLPVSGVNRRGKAAYTVEPSYWKHKTMAHIVASVEAAIGRANASESVTAKARMNVIGAISRARLPPKNITSQEAQALRDLAKDEDILVLPADKGKATVVMVRAVVGQILNDEKTYQLLKRYPTVFLERKMNLQLLHLVRMGRLHNDVYLRLRSSPGRTPLFYGLPKVHKPSVPLHPIVSFVSSPTHHLSKFLADLLQPVVGKASSHVKNSREFVDFIQQKKCWRKLPLPLSSKTYMRSEKVEVGLSESS